MRPDLRLLGVAAPLPTRVRALRQPSARPPDFVRFWSDTLGDLVRTDPEIMMRDTVGDDGLVLADLAFTSLHGARISGYVLRWRNGPPRPLVVHSHGYGSHYEVRWDWARAGFHVVGVDVRGFGRSHAALPRPSPYGWVLTGISSPETSVLRGAVCDYVRAVEVGMSVLGEERSATVLSGTSLAGAMAVMAEAQWPSAALLAVAVPTLGWPEGRRLLVRDGSGLEITRFLDASAPELEEDIMTVLRYFDTAHHAALIAAPAVVGVGQRDDVVPAATVYPVVNALSGPVEVWELPVSHTTLPDERWWQRFEGHWLRRAASSGD